MQDTGLELRSTSRGSRVLRFGLFVAAVGYAYQYLARHVRRWSR